MSPRAKTALFFSLAGLAALAGATMVGSYREDALRGYGPLRPVVVTVGTLAPGAPLTPRDISGRLGVRQVPERFVPAGALSTPAEAAGLEARVPLPPESYLTRSALKPPGGDPEPRPQRLPEGRQPVEIAVLSAAGLSAGGGAAAGARVDVVVTTEPGPGRSGRTYIAAPAVPLIRVAPGGKAATPGSSRAVLGLRRAEALELIRAESFARSIRLLPR